MKKGLVLVCLCWCGFAVSAESLVFRDVPALELVRFYLSEIVKEGYIVESGVDGAGVVSVDLRGVDLGAQRDKVVQLAKSAGLVVEKRAGVWVVRRGKEGEGDVSQVYRVKHRPWSYLGDVVAAVYPRVKVSSRRAVSAASLGVGSLNGGGVERVPLPVDRGDSGFSQVDKVSDIVALGGSASDVESAVALLGSIDIPVPELNIRASVYEVQTGVQSGSALSLVASLVGGRVGVDFQPTFKGDHALKWTGGTVQAVFQALDSDSRFKVVSQPYLRVRSGHTARISVGGETPVLAGVSQDKNGNAMQSVQYRPSGVILELKPEAREDVTELTLTQTVSQFLATTTGVNNSPTLSKRELSTLVGVRPGDVLILGGMVQDNDAGDTSGPRWLPGFLRASGSNVSRTEVLLVLHVERI